MKGKWGRRALLLLVVVNVSALLTFAYNRWVREPSERPALAEAFTRELCLNGQQEKCIKDFRCSFDSETGEIHARMEQKMRALVQELKKASPDDAALDKLIEEISRLQEKIQKKAVRNLLKEKEVLTDGQKEKFFRLFEDHVCPRIKQSGGSPAARRAGCPADFLP